MRRREVVLYMLGGIVGVIMGITESARSAGQISVLAEIVIDLVPIAVVSYLVLKSDKCKGKR